MARNIDVNVVDDFGREWTRFDQSALSEDELKAVFESYFACFPWEELPQNAVGADIGCGSGRWARFMAPKVGTLHCVEPSQALDVAKSNLRSFDNVEFHQADVDALPFEDGSLDFVYSLGVLHHIPDTAAALATCASKLKAGGVGLIYLYYRFDNRPKWFQRVWQVSEGVRALVSRLPSTPKHAVADALALSVYLPLARASMVAEKVGLPVENIPLSSYRNNSFYTMRTDSLDRFGTRLEQRFTRQEIEAMMLAAGFEDVVFSETVPFWCAVGRRAR